MFPALKMPMKYFLITLMSVVGGALAFLIIEFNAKLYPSEYYFGTLGVTARSGIKQAPGPATQSKVGQRSVFAGEETGHHSDRIPELKNIPNSAIVDRQYETNSNKIPWDSHLNKAIEEAELEREAELSYDDYDNEGYENNSLTSNEVQDNIHTTPKPHRISVTDILEGRVIKTQSVLYTEEDVQALPPSPDGRKFPICLIIGSRKAGTGALRDFLDLHPHIRVPLIEPAFFFHNESYVKGLEHYLKQLPRCKKGQLVVEKSAEYFHTPGVAQRVHAFNSSIKLMLIVRDPVVRMISDYLFLQRYEKKPNAQEKRRSIEELIVKDTGEIRTTWGCLKRSVYYVYLMEWLQFFPKEQILVIDGDEFSTENPGKQLQRVEKFLGIQPHLSPDMFYFNKTKNFYCTSKYGCMEETKGHEQPKLEPSLEEKVRDYFRPFNEKLFELIGRSFDWR